MNNDSRKVRRAFGRALFGGLKIVWPILSALLVAILCLGIITGWLESWPLYDSVYFSFITGLTIGYGDLAPTMLSTRLIAICIGLCVILFIALVAAVAVKALTETMDLEIGRS